MTGLNAMNDERSSKYNYLKRWNLANIGENLTIEGTVNKSRVEFNKMRIHLPEN